MDIFSCLLIYEFFADGIGLPAFGPAGMENWGLVKYKERLILLKEGETSAASKESIAKLIAHEIGHQVTLGTKQSRLKTEIISPHLINQSSYKFQRFFQRFLYPWLQIFCVCFCLFVCFFCDTFINLVSCHLAIRKSRHHELAIKVV